MTTSFTPHSAKNLKLEHLNSEQHKAVTAKPEGHLRILAGAGSGKTRVLVHRIAWLIENQFAAPQNILAVTFTNKAANEMKSRIESLLGHPHAGMWIGTFHSIAHRFLRRHYQEANLPQQFQVLDADDQFRLVKRIIKAMNLDEYRWSPREAQWFINAQKDKGLRPTAVDDNGNTHTRTLIRLYENYQANCDRSGLVDFTELLLKTFETLRDNATLLAHYQQRFQHILVDEFQDTNTLQYAWLKLLMGQHNHMMIVGDDDQSIYGWRGACVDNIHQFSEDFPNTLTIRLEQNYRSTGNILGAANALIVNNDTRLGKELWTQSEAGDLIAIYSAFNEMDEARFIMHEIASLCHKGHHYGDCAILYRSNAQSRVLEEACLTAGVPYRVYGGLRFFERAEIKDAISYLRIVANPNDDAAFERIVNLPARGIGEKTLGHLREQAKEANMSLWHATLEAPEKGSLPKRALEALATFVTLIGKLQQVTENLTLSEQTDLIINESGLRGHYQKQKGETAKARLDNLDELVSATKQFAMEKTADEAHSLLVAFLSHAALEAGDQQSMDYQDCVQLMTLHAAKGLEFPVVFMSGMEERLFPHQMAVEEGNRLEEERRLCYVGMTRAQTKLYFTHAEVRRQHRQEEYHYPSRFIKEIPSKFLDPIRMEGVSQPASMTETHDSGFYIGQWVQHPSFGEGIITHFEGQGGESRVQVNFTDSGSKWLVLAYANLETLESS